MLRVDFLQINLLILMLNLYTLKSIKATTMIIIIMTMTYVTELSGASVRTSRDHHLRTSLAHTMTCGKKQLLEHFHDIMPLQNFVKTSNTVDPSKFQS